MLFICFINFQVNSKGATSGIGGGDEMSLSGRQRRRTVMKFEANEPFAYMIIHDGKAVLHLGVFA